MTNLITFIKSTYRANIRTSTKPVRMFDMTKHDFMQDSPFAHNSIRKSNALQNIITNLRSIFKF